MLEVTDVQQPVKGLSVHQAVVREGEALSGATVLAQVDVARRRASEAAHTGTHIVHAALHDILGPEAVQRGSFNKEGYLRFDFAWGEGLAEAQRREIEEVSNAAIHANHEVVTHEMALDESKAMGAMSPYFSPNRDMAQIGRAHV